MSKSYIEKTKALMHNNKAMKGYKKIQKSGRWQDSTSIKNKKQDIQSGVVKDGILVKEGEWSKLFTSLEY